MTLLGGWMVALLAAQPAAKSPAPATASAAAPATAALSASAAAPPSAPDADGVPLAPLSGKPDLVPLVPPPAEFTLSLRDGDWRVHVNLRPGDPQPGAVLDLLFDVGRQKQAEAGEPQPVSDAKLMLTVSGPGPKLRYLVRPLGDAGVYGAHWTPSGRGLWTLALAPYQDQGPSVSFQVGAGEPMPASAQGHMVQASRMVVASHMEAASRRASEPALTVRQLMEDLGKRWQKEADQAQPDPAQLEAMSRLLEAVQGQVPRAHAGAGAEFDALAAAELATLAKGALPEAASCLECHVKFRDGWALEKKR